jgi:hypothetical protein
VYGLKHGMELLRFTLRLAVLSVTVFVIPIGCGSNEVITNPGSPGIRLALAPSAFAVAPGGSATSIITLTREGGFDGEVHLALRDEMDPRITVTFSPDTLRAGSNTATLTVAASATRGLGCGGMLVTGSAAGVTDADAELTYVIDTRPDTVTALVCED